MDTDAFLRPFLVPPGRPIVLARDYDPAYTAEFLDKSEAEAALQRGIEQLARYQEMLYAQNQYALLIVIQGMDASGKDSLIKHVMSGLNPQGTQVYSFKAPSAEELDHDYLWRHVKALPERGRIGIFNRSHYEEVLIVRVYPEILAGQHLPPTLKDEGIWQRRFEEINNFEKFLVNNGTVVIKFFLNVSKEEQRKRFLERIELPEKNWKFSLFDVKQRARWDDYMRAYEDMLNHTSTPWAPWYVIPADRKWFARLVAAEIIVRTLAGLNLAFPTLDEKRRQELAEARMLLAAEAAKP
ncbi:MAG: polyphosphate kinase 2 family protein [Caldilineales bacterium]|nr:polyphosphate kinase 2 family protein [Caldilineales bacterium]